jgi:hypothetical protein
MGSKAIAFLAAGILALGWALASSSNGELLDLGGGLVQRGDGSVVGAWELPGCETSADAFDSPEMTVAMPVPADRVWRMRLDRGW